MSKYALVNGIILDGSKDMKPVEGKIIFIEDEVITDIKEGFADTTGYEAINLNGGYIMPGLINLHVHIPATGKPKKKQTDPKKLVAITSSTALLRKIAYKLCAGYVNTELLAGVTTVRTVGGTLNYDSRLRDDIAANRLSGPRIVASNMAISVPGGHMAGSLAYEVTNEEEAVKKVKDLSKEGVDLIKLMITGGVLDAVKRGEPGVLKMQPEIVKAACDEAHRLGLKVAAHVESPEGVRVALENGVDTIEHGAKPDDNIIDLFKKTGACHISTLSPALSFALFDREISHATEEQQFNGKIVFDGIVECAKACLANGITVGLGTDTGCPYTTHYDMWRELALFVKYCGVSNNFAIHTATMINASILGMEERIGSIACGKCADLIVCKDNPLENISALRNLSMVMSRGNMVDISKLKKYANVERELDKYM